MSEYKSFPGWSANKIRNWLADRWCASNTDARLVFSALRERGKLVGTIKAAMAKRSNRRKLCSQPDTLKERLARRRITIPLGHDVSEKFRNLAYDEYPRRKNWNAPVAMPHPAEYDADGWYVATVDEGSYSRQCTYHKLSYHANVASYGVVLSPARLRWRLADETEIIKAPRGWTWGSDDDGIFLVANRNSRLAYHPTAGELLPINRRTLAATAIEHYRTRQRLAREAVADRKRTKRDDFAAKRAMKQAEKEGLVVGVADSVMAGNCRGGTQSWATRHGLDIGRHYTPAALLEAANGDARRVALVICQALRRHRREMTAGFCLIDEH